MAFAVTLYFLDDHGYMIDFSHAKAEQFVLRIAVSALSNDQATAMLREHLDTV